MARYILLICFLVCFSSMMGQSLEKHLWKNRILLVVGEDSNNEIWQNQLAVFEDCKQDLKERKIVRYHILPDKYQVVASPDSGISWFEDEAYFAEYHTSGQPFTVVLIGLDGGIKLNNNSLLSCIQLNAVIDQMPMRQAEIRKQSGTNK